MKNLQIIITTAFLFCTPLMAQNSKEEIIKRLLDPDAATRAKAISSLAKTKDPGAIDFFIEALKDKDENVRAEACFSLNDNDDPRVLDPLIALFKDPSPRVRDFAAGAVASIRKPQTILLLSSALQDQNAIVRATAINALGDSYTSRDRFEVNTYSPSEVRAFKVKIMELLIRTINDPEPSVRESVLSVLSKPWVYEYSTQYVLEELKDPQITEILISVLEDSNKDIKEFATSALGSINLKNNPKAIDLLISALDDRDRNIRKNAVEALGKLSDHKVVHPLIAALRDSDSSIRTSAAQALHKSPIPGTTNRAVASLIILLEDDNLDIRNTAAYSLADINSSPARAALMRSFRRNDLSVVAGACSFFIQAAVGQEALIQAFHKYGNEYMAVIYLNSSNSALAKEARDWANRNNYDVRSSPGSSDVKWGSRK